MSLQQHTIYIGYPPSTQRIKVSKGPEPKSLSKQIGTKLMSFKQLMRDLSYIK